jgi:geranylgeranyl pyrophosphate synthase
MLIDEGLAAVEAALGQAVTSDVAALADASAHIIRSGGKRLRPRMVLLAYKAAGGKEVLRAVPFAATIELIHTASLVHDDINDHSSLRRGAATVNARWSDSLALLTGDFMFGKLLRLVVNMDPRILLMLADACIALVEGETRQMVYLGDQSMTEETYLQIIGQKTAALFSACTEGGGILAEASEAQIIALREYGLNLGIAFQIRDDTLDLVGKPNEMGKPIASDLAQGKMGLATLFALKTTPEAQQILTASDPKRIIQFLRACGALDYAMSRAQEYAARAQRALATLPASASKKTLSDLADFALARSQ